MGEVTKHNFVALLPEIKEAVANCDFIALDLEFTGLESAAQYKPSYFDSPEVLYEKLRNRATKFTVLQVGLATFAASKNLNQPYTVRAYNFFVFPTSIGSVNAVFSCQASSLDFLRKHGFDFNKCVGEGVGFLNECQEKVAKAELEGNLCLYGIESLTDRKATQAVCSQVAAWLATAEDESTFTYVKSTDESVYPNCVLHELLKQRFTNVWPCPSSEEVVVVKKITSESRARIEAELAAAGIGLKDDILSRALGFSQVIRLVSSSKKPIVGHNMLTDLVFLHEKFYKTLPGSCQEFKSSIRQLFPVIIDTKHVASVIRKHGQLREYVESTALYDLYKSLSTHCANVHSLFYPRVTLAQGCPSYGSQELIHEAGYDAFVCGVVFLQLAHLWSTKDVPSTAAEPLSFKHYLSQLKPLINQVNLSRGSVTHLNLCGADPHHYRPPLLFVRLLDTSGPSLNLQQVVTLLSAYGSVDVRMASKRTALVAVSNQYCQKDILRNFYKDKRLFVTRYSFWRHSEWVQRSIWAGIVLSTAACIWALARELKNARGM